MAGLSRREGIGGLGGFIPGAGIDVLKPGLVTSRSKGTDAPTTGNTPLNHLWVQYGMPVYIFGIASDDEAGDRRREQTGHQLLVSSQKFVVFGSQAGANINYDQTIGPREAHQVEPGQPVLSADISGAGGDIPGKRPPIDGEAGEPIRSRESSFTKSRFIGVPNDDQLVEKASFEGVLGGRTIAEVHAEDTAALESAGYSWDQAVKVLHSLAVAAEYKYGEEPVGFQNIQVRSTGSISEFSNIIKDEGIQGDPTTLLEARSRFTHEYEVTIDNGTTFVINPQTLFLAEAFHILEKGNRYALTGSQLAELIKRFDRQAFENDEQFQEWMGQEHEGTYSGYKAVVGHKEKVTFEDDIEVELDVSKRGSFSLYTSSEKLPRVGFSMEHKKGEMKRIAIDTERFTIFLQREPEGWKLSYYDRAVRDSWDISYQQLPENSPLWEFVKLGQRVVERAKNQTDGLLNDEDAKKVHFLIKNRTDFLDGAAE